MLYSVQNRILNVISWAKHQTFLLRLFTTVLYICIVGFYALKKVQLKNLPEKIMS